VRFVLFVEWGEGDRESMKVEKVGESLSCGKQRRKMGKNIKL
jgi:hypothetical protein